MAPFSPPINPLNPQDYGSKSRPVDIDQGIKPQGVQTNEIMPHGVMQGDESAKYAGEATASGIKAGAVQDTAYADLFKDVATTADFLGKAGVTLVKKDIEDKVYSIADKERQAYTDVLEKVKAGGGVRSVLDPNPDTSDDGTGNATPAEVAGLPDTLSALQGARDSGKISGSYYQSRLLAEAKTLRAQYPGFREDIDQQFAKVTGSNPANAYVQSLVSDINRAATSQAGNKNRMLTFIRNNMDTIPNAPDVYKAYEQGQITDEDVLGRAYPYQKMKADLNMNNMIFSNEKLSREDKERVAGLGVDKAAGMVVSQAVETLTGKMGLNTKDDLDKLTSLNASGGIDSKQWQAYGQAIANTRTQLANRMIADADAHGYTAAIGGKGELIKRVNQSLEPLDNLTKRVYDHDFGGIYDAKMQIAATNSETQKGLLNDPKMGPYWRTVQAVKDLGGEQNLQRFNLDTIKGNFNDDFKAYFGRMQKTMASQYNMQTTGVPYTFNDTIDNLKTNKVTDGKFNDAVLNEVKKISDPTIPEAIRTNYALAAFSPGNRGMISRLQADGTDASGKPVTGQTAVFQRFTSPEITKSMWDLGQKNPEIWRQYTTWAKETFSNELMSKEIHDLGKIDTSSTGITVGWDAKNARFTSDYVRNPGNPTIGANAISGAVNRLNGNLSNYKEIAKRTGEDPSAFILKSIADSAGPEVLRNVNGIPYQLMRDMGLAKLRNNNTEAYSYGR